jgi:hypothetical protein
MATPFPKNSFSELPLSWQNTAGGAARRNNPQAVINKTRAKSLFAHRHALQRRRALL